MQVDLARPCLPAMPSMLGRHTQISARHKNPYAMMVCEMPNSYQVRSEKMQQKCSPTLTTSPPSCYCTGSVCVAVMVYGPPSVSEKPAWSLAKGCSQTCCRDFAHCVMCTAFFLLCSREEHFTHDYLDTLQKNKALHYEKGSRSFRKNNAKSHVKCEINIKEKKPCTRASCMKIPINCEDFSTAMKSCNQEDCGVLRNDAAQLAAHM